MIASAIPPAAPERAPPRPDGCAVPPRSPLLARWAPALLVAAALFAAIVIVDPVREFMSDDDGWAYARSVEHLLRTGQYRLDAWSAANMPAQIYLAAGLAKVFGYSLSLLRVSTLLMLVAGLVALYALLRRWSLPAWSAAVLTLGLLASPLVLMLSFTFMSDIQFMGWLLVALWLYARGFEDRSDGMVALGSLAAACAIGTRQFGMALLGGLVVAWILSRPATRPPLRRLLWAAALPLLVAVWQLRAGLTEPNFTQVARLHEQAYFLARPLPSMAHEIGWRLSTVLQYLGLSLLPMFPVLASLGWDHARPAAAVASRRAPAATPTPQITPSAAMPAPRRSGRVALLFALASLIGLLLFSLTPSDISMRDTAGRVLPLWWMLPHAFGYPLLRALAVAGILGAFFLLVIFWDWQRENPRLRDLSWSALLVGATGLSLVALHLSYVQFNDTYVVGLLPFAVLAVGGALARRPQSRGLLAATALWSWAMLLALSLWMRGDFNHQQTQWAVAEQILASGMPPRCIGATRHWLEYHGAFDDWLAATHPSFDARRGEYPPAPFGSLHTPFYHWMGIRSRHAIYRLLPGLAEPPAGWRVIAEVPYRRANFTVGSILLLQRQTPQPPEAEPCPPPAMPR